jgi:ATP-dependent Clp protease ATP-binding subunit ClpA
MGSQIIQDKFENPKRKCQKPQPKLQSRSIGIIETNGASEFINRIDEIVMFCINENITKIVGLQTEKRDKRKCFKASLWTPLRVLPIVWKDIRNLEPDR